MPLVIEINKLFYGLIENMLNSTKENKQEVIIVYHLAISYATTRSENHQVFFIGTYFTAVKNQHSLFA